MTEQTAKWVDETVLWPIEDAPADTAALQSLKKEVISRFNLPGGDVDDILKQHFGSIEREK